MEIKLWENEIPFFDTQADTPNIMRSYFLQTDKALPCVVVLTGGGYHHRAKHEADPVAEFFNGRGFHAVVVDYRIAPYQFPAGLSDVQRAIRILRRNAEEWKIDENRIVVCGFSAGGHLAASALLFEEAYGVGSDDVDEMPHLPNGAILCYPVISMDSLFGLPSCGKYLLGEERYPLEFAEHCLEKRVTDKTAPVFMWHTSEDPLVNVKNSLEFGNALRDHNIPFEMHIFPRGGHGLGLAENYSDIKKWADLAADWIEKNI
jgi:acetyl esterase/lipase